MDKLDLLNDLIVQKQFERKKLIQQLAVLSAEEQRIKKDIQKIQYERKMIDIQLDLFSDKKEEFVK